MLQYIELSFFSSRSVNKKDQTHASFDRRCFNTWCWVVVVDTLKLLEHCYPALVWVDGFSSGSKGTGRCCCVAHCLLFTTSLYHHCQGIFPNTPTFPPSGEWDITWEEASNSGDTSPLVPFRLSDTDSVIWHPLPGGFTPIHTLIHVSLSTCGRFKWLGLPVRH